MREVLRAADELEQSYLIHHNRKVSVGAFLVFVELVNHLEGRLFQVGDMNALGGEVVIEAVGEEATFTDCWIRGRL